jgi:hypothetical protein
MWCASKLRSKSERSEREREREVERARGSRTREITGNKVNDTFVYQTMTRVSADQHFNVSTRIAPSIHTTYEEVQ